MAAEGQGRCCAGDHRQCCQQWPENDQVHSNREAGVHLAGWFGRGRLHKRQQPEMRTANLICGRTPDIKSTGQR